MSNELRAVGNRSSGKYVGNEEDRVGYIDAAVSIGVPQSQGCVALTRSQSVSKNIGDKEHDIGDVNTSVAISVATASTGSNGCPEILQKAMDKMETRRSALTRRRLSETAGKLKTTSRSRAAGRGDNLPFELLSRL